MLERRESAVSRIASAIAHLAWLAEKTPHRVDTPAKAKARSELRLETLPLLASTLEALIGENDQLLGTAGPLRATLEELSVVVQRAEELLLSTSTDALTASDSTMERLQSAIETRSGQTTGNGANAGNISLGRTPQHSSELP